MHNHDEGHAYLSHLQSEHHRLELLSKNVLARFQNSSDASWTRVDRPEVAARLSALRDELSRHFDVEFRGGCVDEAVARMPSLSREARKIDVENDQLKERLEEVVRLVQFGPRTEAERVFRRFAAELRLHEQHEERLVEKGMNTFPCEG